MEAKPSSPTATEGFFMLTTPTDGSPAADFIVTYHGTVATLGAQVERFMETAWEEVIFQTQTCLLDPSGHGLPRGLGDLELHRPRGLLLHDDGPRGDAVAVADVADLQPDEIASAQLAVDTKVE